MVLPIRHVLPELLSVLDRHGSAVLTAPPGTGKTTVVPLALAEAGLRVVVAEPRRLAVRAAARRMGVSYTIRGERHVGANPMVEVVTTGVLLQRLQRDQELTGVDAVVLDECHERHLDADTALAFLLDVRDTLRPDLRLLATSATADAQPWADLIGGPIVAATGAAHPVETVWAPPPRPVVPPHGLRVDPALLSHVAAVVRRALAERAGDVLCFLPGVGEIAKVAGMLAGEAEQLLQVHGQAPAHVQDAVLSPGQGRRVVLATSVAESSLTVPGVRVVVDSGLAREPRTDHARGLGSLTTVRVSKASATQRAGRAGREAPGTVYRCWPAAEHDRLADHARPEIALADLTGFALQTACWGAPDASGLALLDPPPPAALSAALRTLQALGALTTAAEAERARVTERGRRMALAGVHPRLARALLDLGPEAAEVVALLSEQLPRDASDDLAEVWRTARRGGTGFAARWRQEAARLRRTATTARTAAEAHPTAEAHATAEAGPTTKARTSPMTALSGDALAGMAVALAFPERVARRRGAGYLMASGTQAQLPEGSKLQTAPWLAIATADRPTGSASARIRQAVVIDEATARAATGTTTEDEITWRVPPGERRGDVSARRVERLGAIELSATPLKDADVRAAILHGLRTEDLLTWTRHARELRDRLAFCHRAIGAPWPPMDDLVALADQWLEPELSRARRRADVERIDVATALRRLIPWSERLDAVAPERIEVPTGSHVRLDYSGDQPVLAVKLQELFGWQETPRVAGVPVLVHLLSPAGRPLAVTADLASFWREGYRHVRAEMRGRYPKHPWPEDPLTARPTRRTNRSTP
ncbi:ATP-dependent helicase HrpB [Nonomuraea gerenzanensis]|uniref:ATP-dependent RNA helicase n=1 Tax=Nonomuraea gerenzanensis TaxID=93944 RepID=A0A1M4DYT8_9ACTN|nr:ATP-dependent helicase HrpB [Nonomuraea gerenzanensis]UBU14046.1 ATP-dependent helicase HrpB [Nonomuraea gerenzanensis]SBO91736.1 ATP-dependent RNA helicase [Nonomuraea gerenzanensis]